MTNTLKSAVTFVEITADYAGQRIDNYLITRLKSVPKTRIYRILRKGEVRVNKKRVDPSYRLQEGDQVRLPPIRLGEKKTPLTPSEKIKQTLADRILYDDKYLLIINKPIGLPVHGGSGVAMGIIEILRTLFPNVPHLELAHRLDADTSGVLVLAKKRSILKELHEMFRTGTIRKIYLALTKGHWKKEEYRVDAPLHKNILQGGERMVKVHREGKESLTVFKPIQVFKNASLVEATLFTGRTHQIRVHSQYRKHPIAGDNKYGDKEFNQWIKEHGGKRLFLHAHSVEFTLSSINLHVKVTAPLDAEWESCLKNIE